MIFLCLKTFLFYILASSLGNSRFGEAWGLSDAICLMRVPWQLRDTSREIMAVFPKPMLPQITTPRFTLSSSLCSWASISWKSQSRPTNVVSVVILGTSNRSGFKEMSGGRQGAKRTEQRERCYCQRGESGSFLLINNLRTRLEILSQTISAHPSYLVDLVGYVVQQGSVVAFAKRYVEGCVSAHPSRQGPPGVRYWWLSG